MIAFPLIDFPMTNENQNNSYELRQQEHQLKELQDQVTRTHESKIFIVQHSMVTIVWFIIFSYLSSLLFSDVFTSQSTWVNITMLIISSIFLLLSCLESKCSVFLDKQNYFVIRLMFVLSLSLFFTYINVITNEQSAYEIQLWLNTFILCLCTFRQKDKLQIRIICLITLFIPILTYILMPAEQLPATLVFIIASILAYLSGIAEAIAVQQMINGEETINIVDYPLLPVQIFAKILLPTLKN